MEKEGSQGKSVEIKDWVNYLALSSGQQELLFLLSPHSISAAPTHQHSPVLGPSCLSLHIQVMMARMTFPFLLMKSYSQLKCYFLCIKSRFLFQAHSYFHVILNSCFCVLSLPQSSSGLETCLLISVILVPDKCLLICV